MDGYSFPNSYLLAEQAFDHQSHPCTLKDIKGLPNTLDVDALLRDLLRLRTAGREPVLLPSYDRDLHDPVPDSVSIATDCKVVIVEGEKLRVLNTSYDFLTKSSRVLELGFMLCIEFRMELDRLPSPLVIY